MLATRFTAVVLACLGCACAALQPEDIERDASLKKFEPQPSVAGLYIYCNEWMGTIPRSNVSIDGRPLGQIASLSYLYATLAPGPHRVSATASDADEVTLDVEPGHNYYVWHQVTLGFLYPGVKLHVVGDDDGKAGVRSVQFVRPTYRAEDLQALKGRLIAAVFLGNLLAALPGAGGGAIGIDTFAH